MDITGLLKEKCDAKSLEKILALKNEKLNAHIAKYIELCKPDSVYVCDDSEEDRKLMRQKSKDKGEETSLAIDGHTIHFDGPKDQARDKEVPELSAFEVPLAIGIALDSEKSREHAAQYGEERDFPVGFDVIVGGLVVGSHRDLSRV